MYTIYIYVGTYERIVCEVSLFKDNSDSHFYFPFNIHQGTNPKLRKIYNNAIGIKPTKSYAMQSGEATTLKRAVKMHFFGIDNKTLIYIFYH